MLCNEYKYNRSVIVNEYKSTAAHAFVLEIRQKTLYFVYKLELIVGENERFCILSKTVKSISKSHEKLSS